MPDTKTASTATNRLTPADYLFAWQDQQLGASFRCQAIWQFDAELPPEAVEKVRAGFAAGPLSRSVVRSRFLGARPSWTHCAAAGDLVTSDTVVATSDRRVWLQEQMENSHFDLEHGPVWRLSTTTTEQGGTLLSLVWLHAVADGFGALAAVLAAFNGLDIGCLPNDSATAPSVWEEAKDAATRIWMVLCGLAIMLASLARGVKQPKAPVTKQPRPKTPASGESGAPQPQRTSIIEFSREDWSAAAKERGGTDNTLLTALAAQLAVATGCVEAADTIPVELIVSERDLATRDVRGNALVTTTVPTKASEDVRTDLSAIRVATKQALSQLKRPERKALHSLLQLIFFLPNWALARAASGGAPAPCITSNAGFLPAEVLRVDGLTASSLSVRSEWFGTPHHILRKRPANIGLAFFSAENSTTINVQYNNPNSPLTVADLDEIILAEAARFGLAPKHVW